MKIKKGYLFRLYFNDGNLNNLKFCHVRAVVDNEVVVLYCEKDRAPGFYKMISVDEFRLYHKKGHFIPLEK